MHIYMDEEKHGIDNENSGQKCAKMCLKNYYKSILNNRIYHFSNNSNLLIQVKEKRFLIYKAEPALQLSDFLSDIGGLLGIYFGLSMVDLSHLLLNSTKYIKLILLRLVTINTNFWLILIIRRHKTTIKDIIISMEYLRWRTILSLLTSTILIFQLFILTYEYFQYSTETRLFNFI